MSPAAIGRTPALVVGARSITACGRCGQPSANAGPFHWSAGTRTDPTSAGRPDGVTGHGYRPSVTIGWPESDRTRPIARARRRAVGAAGLLAAYGVVVAGWSRPPGRRERALFERANDSGEHVWLRLPQQWGTPWTLPAVALVAAACGRRRHAVVALGCLPVLKGIEVATKRLRPRPRPLYVQPTVLRDDAPVEGGSMPSGHAALAACGTVLLAPLVPRPMSALLAAVTAASGWARIHQGAHEPADVVAGLLLGSGLGLAATGLIRALG